MTVEETEDPFQKLESALRGYKSGGVTKMWGYDVEEDVSNLKAIAFDYIRLDLQFSASDIMLWEIIPPFVFFIL